MKIQQSEQQLRLEKLMTDMLLNKELSNEEAATLLLQTAALCMIREVFSSNTSKTETFELMSAKAVNYVRTTELGLFYAEGTHNMPRSIQ